jgi:hypothetical protein
VLCSAAHCRHACVRHPYHGAQSCARALKDQIWLWALGRPCAGACPEPFVWTGREDQSCCGALARACPSSFVWAGREDQSCCGALACTCPSSFPWANWEKHRCSIALASSCSSSFVWASREDKSCCGARICALISVYQPASACDSADETS